MSDSQQTPQGETPLSESILDAQLFHQLIDQLPVAVYACDTEGRIRLFNETAVNLWGRRPRVGVDTWCTATRLLRIDGTAIPSNSCPLEAALKEGSPLRDAEMVVERPDGSRRVVVPIASPTLDKSGNPVGMLTMLIDVTDRRRDYEIAQARLAAIVESSDDAIVSKTLEGIITSWNQAAERLFGFSADEAIGQSILLIVPPDRRHEEATIIARLRSGQRIDHFETQRQTKDGRMLDISLSVSPVRDSSGTVVGASKVARDITDRKRMERERERILEAERNAREEAQRVNRMKDEFLATLSHELRTPLNAVMGWAQMLAMGRLSPDEMVEAGQVIERNARTQKQLIDDLLDMSRIISGKLRLDVQQLDPLSVIKSAIETVCPSADARGVRIEKVFDPLAGPVSGDPARLQQVMWNLLSNAIKFTPRGGRVQVLLERVESHIELTVSDTGQGIKPEFLPRLFDRFSQADAAINRRHGGLGLGLAIVKQLVELHGGTVRASSAGEGQGATFIVQLPALIHRGDPKDPRVHPNAPTAMLHDPGRTDLAGLKILVVDDEADARKFILRLLRESGAVVQTAETAVEGLQMIERDPPDLLISDIGMPDVDGYDFLRRIRKLPDRAGRIPAIALTAFARSEDRTRALLAGYIAHVAKPLEPSELLATIAVVTGRVAQDQPQPVA